MVNLDDLPPATVTEIDPKTKTILSKRYGYEIGKKLGSGAYGEVRTTTPLLYHYAVRNLRTSFK